ncbi:unnamed protein product [Clavelina lepadiformis]|uniref:Uncharacterized protein n=1 Tax=Clavelina lepadiformis TaxID=159417 RepID=A0ABP0FEL5_CLALP
MIKDENCILTNKSRSTSYITRAHKVRQGIEQAAYAKENGSDAYHTRSIHSGAKISGNRCQKTEADIHTDNNKIRLRAIQPETSFQCTHVDVDNTATDGSFTCKGIFFSISAYIMQTIVKNI